MTEKPEQESAEYRTNRDALARIAKAVARKHGHGFVLSIAAQVVEELNRDPRRKNDDRR